MNVVAKQSVTLRRMTAGDNAAIASVIRRVSAEYGLTADKGYTVADPNLDELYQLYSQPGHAYWVVEQDGIVVGGGGVAPLSCSDADICELQKMYFLSSVRGHGAGKKTGAARVRPCPRTRFYPLLSGNNRVLKRSDWPVRTSRL